MNSILEYNKQKLQFLYIFNADSVSGFSFTVEKIFGNLYDYKVKKYFFTFFVSQNFIQLLMRHGSVVYNSLDNADLKYM